MNTVPPSASGFVAQCANCGAPQAVVLGEPIQRCRHCGTPEPLAGRDRARVEEANALLSRVAVREHRRLLAHRDNVLLIAFLTPLSAGLTWLLFGGLLVAVVKGDLPEDMSLFELARLEHRAPNGAWGDALVTGHWTIFAMLVGLAATLSTYLFALAKACLAGRRTPALPPLAGGPARCHLCGAALAGSGVERRCASCGGRNFVTGRAVHAQVQSLEEQVAALQAQERALGEEANEHAFRAVILAALYPLLLLGAFPLGALVGETRPDLLWIPLAVALPALPALLVILLRLPARAVKLEAAAPGDEVRVRGVAHTLVARLELEAAGLEGLPPMLAVLAPRGRSEASLAVFTRELADANPAGFAVAPGGRPLSPEEMSPEQLASFKVRTLAGEFVGTIPRCDQPGAGGLRIFRQPLGPGAMPIWTLTPAPLERDHVFVP
jgi:hypothetical protein